MSPGEKEKAMAGLLRRSLLHKTGPAESCPGPDVLAAYFEHALETDEVARFEMHVSECARCRAQLAAMARAETAVDKTLADRKLVAEAASAWQRKRTRSWRLEWRWLTPAAAAVVVLVVWFAHRSQPKPIGAQLKPAPPVATSRPSVASDATSIPAPLAAQNDSRAQSPKALARHNFEAAKPLPKEMNPAEVNPAAPSIEAEANSEKSLSVGSVGALAPGVAAAPSAPPPAATPNGVVSEEGARLNLGNGKPRGALAARTKALETRSAEIPIPTPDPKVAWRIARGGVVERTEDGGATWLGQFTGAEGKLTAGSATSRNTCWLVGRDATILRTVDGKAWTRVAPPADVSFIAVTARDEESAIITSADDLKFSTADGGKTWKPLP